MIFVRNKKSFVLPVLVKLFMRLSYLCVYTPTDGVKTDISTNPERLFY